MSQMISGYLFRLGKKCLWLVLLFQIFWIHLVAFKRISYLSYNVVGDLNLRNVHCPHKKHLRPSFYLSSCS